METKPSAQFHFKKLSFGKGSQKARKSSIKLFLSNFTGLLHIVPNILAQIEVQCSEFNAKLIFYL